MHHRARDLTGMRIGMLTVIKLDGNSCDGHKKWSCLCDCGKTKAIASNSLTRSKPVQSCGCLNKIRAQERNNKTPSWNTGQTYSIRKGGHEYSTRHAWAKAAIRAYGNRCGVCGWSEARCDVHHKVSRSDGGKNTLENSLVLCPNHHRIIHEQGGVVA